MRIRFQADANLDPRIGRGLVRCNPAIDWLTAQGTLADGTPDQEVLRLAAADGRVVVTADVRTMLRHFVAFTAASASPGIVLIPPLLTIGETIDKLQFLWTSAAAEDIKDQAWWLRDRRPTP